MIILFCLLGMLLLSPPILYQIYNMFQSELVDDTHLLHIYKEYEWANTHFKEFDEIETTYYDFITWRRDDYIGETINISDGVRATIGAEKQNNDIAEYYFFGGSTTWGTGVNDANTFPSLFAQRNYVNVINFGETGYIARQSLAYLSNFLIKNSINNMSGQHVVFYDGVNDVASRCRVEISGLGTSREVQIRGFLSGNLHGKPQYGFSKTFEQITFMIQDMINKFGLQTQSANQVYLCSSDNNRAKEIAQSLVDTWQAASDLVKSRGGNFTAILQPVAYLGTPITNYINYEKELGEEYKAVYPLVKEIAKEKNIRFIDLTHIYDDCNNCYIDFCHVGPQAHEILVAHLIQNLSQ